MKTTRKPSKKNSKEDIAHYNAILLEDIKSQMKQVIEGIDSTRQELKREISEFRAEANDRFTILETVVRGHSKEIKELKADVGILKTDVGILKTDVGTLKTDVGTLKADVTEIKTEMKDMEKRLSDKIDGIREVTNNHEVRISNLETSRI